MTSRIVRGGQPLIDNLMVRVEQVKKIDLEKGDVAQAQTLERIADRWVAELGKPFVVTNLRRHPDRVMVIHDLNDRDAWVTGVGCDSEEEAVYLLLRYS